MTISSDELLLPGTRLVGKWHGGHYDIEKRLGEGANGIVYLVRKGRKKYALKLGRDPVDLQSEMNVLRMLTTNGEPFLWDTDDAVIGARVYPFYVMTFVEGERLPDFVKQRGADWLYIIIRRILARLAAIHRRGWVFGDLKPDNILVAPSGAVELIDFGGVSMAGSSIRQFTELYDRGFWNAGSRKADPAYDLFALAVMTLQLSDPAGRVDEALHLIPQHRSVDDLMETAESIPSLVPILPFIRNLLEEKYATATDALHDYRGLLLRWQGREERNGSGRNPPHLPWLTAAFLSTLTLFAVILFMYYY